MRNREITDITDAFLALNEIDDDEVEGMLKKKPRNRRHVNEGKEFSLMAGQGELDAAQDFANQSDGEAQIEVIDMNADTEEHLRKKEDYVGQAILRCRRCMTNRFVNLEELEADENDPELYNVDDECPHCHISGEGFELIGQVGKVEEPKEEEKPEEPAEEEAEDEETESEEGEEETEENEGEDSELPELNAEPNSEESGEDEEVTFEAEDEEEDSEEPKFDNDETEEAEITLGDEKEEKEESLDNEAKKNKEEKNESLEEGVDSTYRDTNINEISREVFSDKFWSVVEAFNKRALEILSRGMKWDINNPELWVGSPRFFIYWNKARREKFLVVVQNNNHGMKVIAQDSRGNNIPDLDAISAPDVWDVLNEDLEEAFTRSKQGDEAWMMDQVLGSMGSDEAYYGSQWLEYWPDECSREECEDYFGQGEEEDFEELKDNFLSIYKYFHNDGLYNPTDEVIEYAHKTDALLGLRPIDIIRPNKPQIRESLKVSDFSDILESIVDPDKIKLIEINDVAKSGERKLYEGVYTESPVGIRACPCTGFNTADHTLTCNIDTEANPEYNKRTLGDALDKFNDEDTKKIHIWDDATNEEVFKGNKKDAIKHFGNQAFMAFETPEILRVYVLAPHVIGINDEEETTGEQKLVNDIIKANDLSSYKLDNVNTNEYWIRQSIHEKEDLKTIYEKYIRPINDDGLTEDFKRITGYSNPLEEAYQEGIKEACRINEADNAAEDKAEKEVEASMKKLKAEVKKEVASLERELKKLEAKAAKNNPNVAEQKAALKAVEDKKAKIKKWKSFIGESLENDLNEIYEPIESFTSFKFANKTAQGFDIVKTFIDMSDRRLHVIAYRPGIKASGVDLGAYAVGIGYSPQDGTWNQGWYDIETVEEAEDALRDKYNIKPYIYSKEQLGEAVSRRDLKEAAEGSNATVTKGVNAGLVVTPESENVQYAIDLDFNDVDYYFSTEDGDGKIDYWTWSHDLTVDDIAYALGESDHKYTQEEVDNEDLLDDILTDDVLEELSQIHYDEGWEDMLRDEKNGTLIDDPKAYVFSDSERRARYEAEQADLWNDEQALERNRNESLVTSYKTRKELTEALKARNNNKPYTIRRSQKEGYRYDLVEANAITRSNNQVQASAMDRAIVSKIAKISKTIADEIERVYDIDANPAMIVADIARDLRLISGQVDVTELGDTPVDVATAEMYRSYETFYSIFNEILTYFTGEGLDMTPAGKLTFALKALNSPAFSEEGIRETIESTRFQQALESGQVPYIGYDAPQAINAPTEAEEIEFDETGFDNDINQYFDESYEDTVIYNTNEGSIYKDGTIVLEGMLTCNEVSKPIKFTLTPKNANLNEDLNKNTYIVKNDISEEVFEFNLK